MKILENIIKNTKPSVPLHELQKYETVRAKMNSEQTEQKKMNEQELVLNLNTKNMDTISFDKLLLKSAFCCMASDGHIDNREIALIKSMCEKSPLFKDFNFKKKLTHL